MSWSNHEISDYIDDLPMKISNSFMPKYFHIEMPEILSPTEVDYDFKTEKEAVKMAEIAEEEKIKETEKLLQSGTLKDFSKKFDDKHQPIDQASNNISPLVPGSPCIPMLPTVPMNGIVSNQPSQPVVTNFIASPAPHHQMPPPPPPPPTPLQQPSIVSNVLSTPLLYSQINCDSSTNSIDNSGHQHHHNDQQQQHHNHHNEHQQHHQNNHNQNQPHQQFIPKTRINPADFESSSSSPFDDALLRAIDDKQELNHVFQHY